jgi:hypothetical protein
LTTRLASSPSARNSQRLNSLFNVMKRFNPIQVSSRVVVFLFLLACCRMAHAEYSIDWYSIDGGGGTSTNGIYSVSGTIGQHDAGTTMSGGDFSLTGGFWSIQAIQTAGAPLLGIRLTGTNTAQVYWPSPSTGWNLQVNSDLSTTNWIAPGESVTDDGTNKFILVNPSAGNRFFRLKNP